MSVFMYKHLNDTIRKLSVITCILLLHVLQAFTSLVFAQAVKTDFDKKIILTDSLNMPRNVSASSMLSILPELLQRPGDTVLSNYDVMIEGMSVGSAADVALLQLQVADIEKIEVSESAISSYQNNGQGGSINIVLRSSGTSADDRYRGSVGIHAYSSLDLAPQLNLCYKNKKFMLHGIVLAELANIDRESNTFVYHGDELISNTAYADFNKFRTELARVYMQYDFTERDRLKLSLSEKYMYNRVKNVTDYEDHEALYQQKKSLNLQANLSYKHTTERSSFNAEIEYGHYPSWTGNDVTAFYSYMNDKKLNTISGKVEYKTSLFNRLDVSGMTKQGDLTLGMNFNASLGSEKERISDSNVSSDDTVREVPYNDTYFITPYVTFTTTLGRLRLKASGELQSFRYEIEKKDKSHSAVSNDFTGKLMAEWYFTPSRNLRFILDRKLNRPSSEQLYPYRTFDSDRLKYVEGNPDLIPMMVHETSLEYITTHRLGQDQRLTASASASISRITDIIKDKTVGGSSPDKMGATLEHITYENLGSNTVASANLMALYSYKAFSLSFVGNLYHKVFDANNGNDHYTYYNLSIYPYFRLKDGWHGGTHITYYSRINQKNASLGDAAVADMTVGKSFKKFFVFLSECVSITKYSRDIITSGSERREHRFKVIPDYIGAGVTYTF